MFSKHAAASLLGRHISQKKRAIRPHPQPKSRMPRQYEILPTYLHHAASGTRTGGHFVGSPDDRVHPLCQSIKSAAHVRGFIGHPDPRSLLAIHRV
jgi:hypothetical protein